MAASGGHWVKGAGGARFKSANAKSGAPLIGWARASAQQAGQQRRSFIRGSRPEDQRSMLRFVADHDRGGLGVSAYTFGADMSEGARKMWRAQRALLARGWVEGVGTGAWPRLRLTPRGRRALARLGE
ncbi:MAG: hypothetical protein GX597_13710 [Anaerolineaceae bacterium]|nr:hypothetical protein [Anaerolineaceae bacterium]